MKTAKYDNGFLGKQGAVHVKPRLLEARLADDQKFQKLSHSFKKTFADDSIDQHSLKIPIVGYTGHRKGEISENIFGKNYRN